MPDNGQGLTASGLSIIAELQVRLDKHCLAKTEASQKGQRRREEDSHQLLLNHRMYTVELRVMKSRLSFWSVVACALLLISFGASCKPKEVAGDPAKVEKPEVKQEQKEPTRPPFDNISLASLGQRVPVMMYHDVIAIRDKDAQWYDCAVAEFREQMDLFTTEGVTPISVADLYKHLTEGTKIPDKAVVLTFDDNYQGFYDLAWPILKEKGFPAMMFVHTGFVGNKEGLHPKMDYDTLRTLLKDPLFSVGCHTISHPDDMSTLSTEEQTKELTESKATLEKELNIKVDFLAYPNGKNDAETQRLTKEAGYKMAFTIKNGTAEGSPNIFAINRYVHTRYDKASEQTDKELRGGALGVFEGKLKVGPVAYKEEEVEKVKLALVIGGMPESMMSETREGVLDFIKRSPGAVAGINGGFFAMAAIKSTDNQMVGPCKTTEMPALIPDANEFAWDKLRNRPVVIWGKSKFAILAYNPEAMNSEPVFKNFMPDYTDTFLAGVWLVHDGLAREKDDMGIFASKDIQDPRRRAFLGIMPDGQIVAGASKSGCSSAQLASAIAAAGIKEAVLLDSGFSTSLVYGEKIMASGHSTAETPSRPVPHAIVLKGTLDASSQKVAEEAEPATKPEAATTKTKKKKAKPKKPVDPDSTTPAPSNPPD